jgi:hypothetical protein
MKRVKNKKSFLKRYGLIVIGLMLVIGAILFTLEKTHVINLYHKKTTQSQKTDQPRAVNSVDYSKSTSNTSDSTINSAKNSSAISNSESSQQNPIGVTITNVNNNSVAVLINNATSGTCVLELSQNGSVIYTPQASVIQQNNIFICGFYIASRNIPNSGTYTAKVTVSLGTRTGSDTEPITLVK